MSFISLTFYKITRWEYWPPFLVNFPIIFAWIYYSIRCKSFFFFNTSNPLIENGGFMMESKIKVYDLIPPPYYPKTIFVSKEDSIETLFSKIQQGDFSFPFIVKPNVGLKGLAVQKINNLEELKNYKSKSDFDLLIQDFVPFPNEIGIFFIKKPGEEKGEITGIVHKEFMKIIGDGRSTIRELIIKNPRFHLQLKDLEQILKDSLHKVLSDGEEFLLLPVGSHTRGTKFSDVSNRITPKLESQINKISGSISEFYYGRLDIRFDTWEELEEGKNFSIIELNGAGGDPTHIFGHSLGYAWKEIWKHIRFLYEISKANHKTHDLPFLTFKEGIKMLKSHNAHQNRLLKFFK